MDRDFYFRFADYLYIEAVAVQGHHAISYLVYCRRVYRRVDCQCDNAYSLGFCWNYFARHRGFCDRRFDCSTVTKRAIPYGRIPEPNSSKMARKLPPNRGPRSAAVGRAIEEPLLRSLLALLGCLERATGPTGPTRLYRNAPVQRASMPKSFPIGGSTTRGPSRC
jgi:hypothetical protein